MCLQICFNAKEIDFAEWKGDFLAVAVCQDDLSKDSNSKFKNSILNKLDVLVDGLLAETSTEEDFGGKTGQLMVLKLPGHSFRRVGLIGLGKCTSSSSCSTNAYKGLGRIIASVAKSSQVNNAAVVLISSHVLSLETKLNTAYSVASGLLAIFLLDPVNHK